jgi:hypothetical protein
MYPYFPMLVDRIYEQSLDLKRSIYLYYTILGSIDLYFSKLI